MTYSIGIDLGTTYTAAAIHRNGRASIFSLGGRSASIPSVVLLREDETVLTGDAAVRRAITEPERVAREFKRRLGDTTPIIVGGSPYSAEALMARLLKSVLEEVEKREGEAPERVAISHPANWGPYKIDLLKQATRIAGLDADNVDFLTEPEAAVISYASQERVEAGEVVAVYDLGGGTFDAAVLRRTADGFEIIGKPEGIERLGGIDFDAAVFAHVARSLDGALQQLDPEDPAAQAAMSRLRRDCVDAKEALSSDTDATIPVLLPNLQTDVRITRREYESLIRPSLVDSIEAMRRALASAGVTPEEVSRVLLVGGSSRTPLIGQLVSSELGRPVAVDAHPKHAVALGAAHAAAGDAGGSTAVDSAAVDSAGVGQPSTAATAAAAASALTPPVPTTPPVPDTPPTPATPTTPSASAPPAGAPTDRPAPPGEAPAPPASIFGDTTPDLPAGVPVVPSQPSTPATHAPTQAIPVVPDATPDAAAPASVAGGYSSASDPAPGAPGAPTNKNAASSGTALSDTSGSKSSATKGRGPLVAALAALVIAAGVGGYVLTRPDDTEAAGTTSSTTEQGEEEASSTTVAEEETTTTEAEPKTDAELRTEITALVGSQVEEFEVEVVEGTAILSGFVETVEERDDIQAQVAAIDGVVTPVNNIVGAPQDEWCTEALMSAERWVCITSAELENGIVTADFEFSDGDEAFNTGSGFHLHVFGSDVDPITAGGASGGVSTGGGHWRIWDITPQYNESAAALFTTAEIPEKVCARIANSSHALVSLESGNCFPLTNLDATDVVVERRTQPEVQAASTASPTPTTVAPAAVSTTTLSTTTLSTTTTTTTAAEPAVDGPTTTFGQVNPLFTITTIGFGNTIITLPPGGFVLP